MAGNMRTGRVAGALDMALARRRPGTWLVHHSDRGTRHTSLAFGCRLRGAGIARSMGSIGDCYQEALAESLFAALGVEPIDRSAWATMAEARAAVFECIEVLHDRIRRHSALGYLSPDQYGERYRSSLAVEVARRATVRETGATPDDVNGATAR